MAEQFYTIITKIGKAKIANATALGTKVNLTKFQVGDGNGSYYNPTEDQLQLRKKVWEGNISSITVDTDNPNWIVLETIIPGDIGGFMIREAAALDDEGNIIAIGKYPETYKPLVADGSTKDLYIRMILEISNTSSVTLKVDPTVILATKKDIEILDNKIKNITASDIKTSSGATIESSLSESTTKINFLEELKLKFIYGAVLDGIADDTIPLQNYANDNIGKELILPSGIVRVTSPIQMSDITDNNNFRSVSKIKGQGIGKTVILNDIIGEEKAVFEWNQSVTQSQNYKFGLGAYIEDIEIKGNVGNTSNGVKAEGIFFLNLERCYIHDCGRHGVYMPYDVDLENDGDDGYLTGYTRISQCFIKSNGQNDKSGSGIFADKLSATFIIENSHITDNFGWGVRVSTRELKIFRNAISNNGYGDNVTRYGGLRVQRASSIISGALPHSNIFEANEFDGNWGVEIDLYSCGYSKLENCMIIPRAIDKLIFPNVFRAPIGIKIGGNGNSDGSYNDIIKPVFRVTDYSNGGNTANDPDYTCVKVENVNYGNKVIEPLLYNGFTSKLIRISDVSGYNNIWLEANKIKHKSGDSTEKPIAIGRQPSPTSVSASTITKLTWTSKQLDNYSMFDNTNGEFNIPFNGAVNIKGYITIENATANISLSVLLYLNGSSYKQIHYITKGGTLESIPFEFDVFANAGKYDIRILSSSNITINSADTRYSNICSKYI